ncbi:MAG: hypothetical protein RL701_3591 [Pseudomonadota bacterium]|jgi:hypothetical protein
MSDADDKTVMPARRDFMLKALVGLPAAGWLVGCASDPTTDIVESEGQTQDLGVAHADCHELHREQHTRARWRRWLDAHMGQENLHDLPGVMATFSETGEMIFNRQPFTTPEAIAQGHVLFGMSAQPGALANTQVIPERAYFTDDEVLVEGKVVGDHVGDIQGFAATGRRVELHYAAFYRFDPAGELVSERITMDWSLLAMAT